MAIVAGLSSAIRARAGEDASLRCLPQNHSVEQLIERLDSDDFASREAATRALMKRPDAEPAVRRALHSKHPEVRLRAGRILEELHRQTKQRQARRSLEQLRNGEVDQFIEWATTPGIQVEDNVWLAVLDLADRLTEQVNEKRNLSLTLPIAPGVRATWPRKVAELGTLIEHHRIESRKVVTREMVRLILAKNGLLISQYGIDSFYFVTNSILLVNGDLIVRSPGLVRIRNSIVICDGRIECEGAADCILIATGPIKVRHPGASCVIVEHAREAFGLIKFFDPRQAGLEVTESEGKIVVKRVLENQPFARSGMREGDRILAIDGAKVSGLQAFRRLLRHNAFTHKETRFTVEQANERAAEIKVQLMD